MLSTVASGGMAQVVDSLRESPLFARYSVRVIATHDRGSASRRAQMFIRAFVEYCGLLLTGRVGLVHAHVAMRGSFWRKSLFLWTARLFRVPVIVHLHGSQFEDFYEKECGPIRRALIRRTFRAAAAVIVLSEKWRSYIATAEPAARVRIVHNFVDAQRLQTEIERVSVTPSEDNILFLGELGDRKGIYDLLRAMPHILSKCPNARLIAGGTGEIDKARDVAREAGVLSYVSFPGWVTGDDKIRLLATCAVFVLPSHNENFPVSILEAMAARKPVVATPVGGVPDMLTDGVEGYLIAPGDRVALAQQITALLSNAELRDTMGDCGWQRINAKFTVDGAVAILSQLYDEYAAGTRADYVAEGCS